MSTPALIIPRSGQMTAQQQSDFIKAAFDQINALHGTIQTLTAAHNNLAKRVAEQQNQVQKTAAQVTSIPSLDILSGGVSTQLRVSQSSVLPAHNTGFVYVATDVEIDFYADGTNGSSPIVIAWPDGTTTTCLPFSLKVTGLSPSTPYYFYAGYDVRLNLIQFSPLGCPQNCPPGIGSPLACAYPAPNIFANAGADGDGMQNLSDGPMVISTTSGSPSTGSAGGK